TEEPEEPLPAQRDHFGDVFLLRAVGLPAEEEPAVCLDPGQDLDEKGLHGRQRRSRVSAHGTISLNWSRPEARTARLRNRNVLARCQARIRLVEVGLKTTLG